MEPSQNEMLVIGIFYHLNCSFSNQFLFWFVVELLDLVLNSLHLVFFYLFHQPRHLTEGQLRHQVVAVGEDSALTL